jgi:hypothetical protein
MLLDSLEACMTEQLLQSNCVPAPRARWTIDIAATMVVMGVAVAVASLVTSPADGASARTGHATTPAFSRLSEIPSHNGVYRASLVPSSDLPGRSRLTTWTVKVETAAGMPVEDATLALESWMPEDDRVPARHPRVTGYVGDGRYQVAGLRFDRRGWWNVRLQIARPGVTDSLAFNLMR